MEINPSDYTILIVDDNATNIMLLQAILRRSQYNTISASNGKEALLLMQEHLPDLVLLDIMMPEMDGFEVAKKKNEIDSIKEIPFLFVTALSDTNNMVKGFKLGCSDFITKPFITEEILIRINHQIESVANKRLITRQTNELKRVIKSRDILYAVVAHDLRSPLGTIKTALNILDENLNNETIGEDLYDILHTTTESADELFILLENLLSWTKSQMGKLIFNPSNFPFCEAVNDAIKAATSMANIQNITINYNDFSDNVIYCGDKNMITAIIRNIIVNAIKFSEEGSSIEIETVQSNNKIICNVIDHGCGMTDDVKQSLKEKISITTSGIRNEEGTGLGLTICREFLKLHNGSFYFTSEVDNGSTFSFEVPLS